MAFTISKLDFNSKYLAFKNSSEIHIANVFQHESQGEFVNCLEALVQSTLESAADPLIMDRTQLSSSDLDVAELLEAFLVLERNRTRLENRLLVIVYNRAPHPTHLHNLFIAAAELKSIHYLKLVETQVEALELLGQKG